MIILTVQPTDNIQDYLDIIEQNGGGVLNLNPVSTFVVESDINIPNNTVLNGNGGTIDFNNTAYGIKIIGTALNPKTNCSLSTLTVVNCTTIGVECEYTDNPILNLFDNTLVQNCTKGVDLTNCTAPAFIGTFSDNGTNCEMTNVTSFTTRFSAFSGATSGDGIIMNNCSNATVFDTGIDDNFGNGILMTDCSYISIISAGVFDNGGDGIKLVSGNTDIISNSINLIGNSGYGINIVDNTNINNVITSNVLSGNSSGSVNNNGTTTLIRSNIGVSDN